MTEEIWCPIKGYEGLYEVSDKGRVKSIGYGKEIILSPGRAGGGYPNVCLYKNREKNMCYVHRLVSQAFIPNPENLPQVNHKDENKENNSVHNLEWCSSKYNANFGTRNQRQAEKLSKSVLQYSLDGKFLREWKSAHDVQRTLGYGQGNISDCCRGERKSAYGFVWKYKD